ncbi:MAG TPA: lipocalin family protein [Sphaerochaeta sp.]|nr:lipocalin family protein [Sphaerochaeta sp.]
MKTERKDLQTVPSLDLAKYLGRWYEIARFAHGFEKKLVGVTAEYSLRKDGRIQVVNSGFKHNLGGSYGKAKAVAWRADEAVPGALKVRFFHLFSSDYLVFGLDDEHYRWAVVGNNDRSTLWFLSRTVEVSPALLDQMKALASNQGYDLSGLEMVEQQER